VGGAPLLVAALLAAGPRAQVDAAVETSAHSGSDYPGPLGPAAARTLDLEPRLSVLLEEPLLQLTASYGPRLLLANGGESAVLSSRQSASLAASWRQSRNLEWVASGRFRYGRSELSWDPGARHPFDSLDGLLPLITDELSTDAALGLTFVPARGLRLDAAAGYAAYGGASAASQQLVPLQRGPQIFVALSHELTRNDEVAAELYGSHTTASGGLHSSLLKLTASWRRQLAPSTRGRISLGTSLDKADDASQPGGTDIFPVAAAEIEHDLLERANRIELRALAALEPHYSLLTADLQERAELGASARLVLQDRFSIRARAAAAKEVHGSAGGAHLWVSAVETSFRFRNDVSLTAGAERVWQQVAPGTPVPAAGWFAFTSLTFAAKDIL
jgi:hypothetical protein